MVGLAIESLPISCQCNRATRHRGRRCDRPKRLSTAQSLKNADDRERLAETLHLFIRMYNPHAAREDTVLFPAIHGIVNQAAHLAGPRLLDVHAVQTVALWILEHGPRVRTDFSMWLGLVFLLIVGAGTLSLDALLMRPSASAAPLNEQE